MSVRYFSYIVARDYGFAPNPFWKTCTLATCKAGIRKSAKVGDWVFGTGSRNHKNEGKLVYAMEVGEKLTFDQYWQDDRFQIKKPEMNGSLKQMYGDNIYHKDINGNWLQENSHHALDDGSINLKNVNTDTVGIYVLISVNFFYFGKSCINIPTNLSKDVCTDRQGYIYVKNNAGPKLVEYLTDNYTPKRLDYPLQFNGVFARFRGGR
ncbi:MAG TPA: hypothetical protein VHE59_00450 [Mucilaginibacter sp.]|nr:hypothetical protein [Mucilaginibacter sp.]